MKRAIMSITVIIMISATTAYTQESLSASGIMQHSRQAMTTSAFEGVSVLTITDSRGRTRERTNVTASKSYPDGTEKRIIRFVSPPDVEGTTVLIWDHDSGEDEMWIYLPALRKTRRIISSEKGKSFMGSEFSNSDMYSPPAADFTHRITTQDEDGYWVIESLPVSESVEDQYGYSRKVSRVSKSNYTVSRIDFFDAEGINYKTIEIPEYTEVDGGKFIVRQMKAVNHVDDRSSEIVMKEVNSGSSVKDDLFLVTNLGR